MIFDRKNFVKIVDLLMGDKCGAKKIYFDPIV